eukprot:TRINITY_DN63794_c0_g1_i2.p1 TRINITY_DN63794_c0_g1~~TRINITY_DN63794_c0_g1_i2.p1  ORF type:complete len:414 (+),score=68.16 TRINITY_DN63794_c0_g1_i2:58-1242(+)
MLASGNLLVLAASTAACQYLQDPAVRVVAALTPPSFSLQLPAVSFESLVAVLPSASLMAFLTFGGHLVVAERVRRPQDSLSMRQDLFALGSCSLASGALGGMPVMANLAVCQALAASKGCMATIGSAAGHLLAFYLLPYVEVSRTIPKCAVAAILTVEFAPLLLSVPGELLHLLRQARLENGNAHQRRGVKALRGMLASDLGIYAAAFLSPLVFGIINGSILALSLEIVLAMFRFSGPGYALIGRVPGTQAYDELCSPGSKAVELPKIMIVRSSGPRWFGNAAANSRAARRERNGREVVVSIADWRMVPFLDETALAYYKRTWANRDTKVMVTGACSHVRRQMKDSGLLDILEQPDETLIDLHAAVRFAEAYVEELEKRQVVIGLQTPAAQDGQ